MNLFILSDYLCARSVDFEWWIFHLMLGSPVIKACRDLGIQMTTVSCLLFGYTSEQSSGFHIFAACK